MGSCALVMKHVPTPFAAEALTCMQALKLFLDFGFYSIELEGDSLSVLKKMKSTSQDFSLISAYIADGKRLLDRFALCKILFVGQSENKATHLMEKEAFLGDEATYLVEDAAPNEGR
ncbi:hypothetical protein CXB51_018359 [Gossypium anomalum]|uniref:RNase H type-1 domain-containing protein n=1 Tax=Gossypium anomalum TaxID=47600 RepID=A0A8J5YDJ5_9ROSI|nr:hypothetical protein CXB51_018359 [Gossypium anomalum]